MKIIFIINSISVQHNKKNIAELIDQYMDKKKWEPEIQFTSYANHAAVLAKEAMNKKADVIVAVGGDGTVNEIASEMVNENAILGIIPLGSGNGLARHLNIPLDAVKAIQLINSGTITAIDSCFANQKYFFNVAGVGFDAQVAKDYARSGKRGFLTYFSVIMKNLFSYQSQNYSLKIDEQEINTNAFLIAFGNSSQYGYDFAVAPKADVRDGWIDVCIIRKFSKIILPFLILLILFKKHHWTSYFEIIRVKKITVKSNKLNLVNIDGEVMETNSPLEINIKPQTLKIIVKN